MSVDEARREARAYLELGFAIPVLARVDMG